MPPVKCSTWRGVWCRVRVAPGLAAVEGIRRAGHGFDGEAQTAGRGVGLVCGIYVDPGAWIQARADASPAWIGEKQLLPAVMVKGEVGEGVVYLG